MSERTETSARAGSPPGRLIPLGRIAGTHGVRGLVRFHPYSSPLAALAAVRTVHLTLPAGVARRTPRAVVRPRTLTLLSAHPHGRLFLLQLEGIADIETAQGLVGLEVSIPASDLPARGPDEFYAYELEGLEVLTASGDRIGRVESLFPTASNDVLVVRDGEREHLIPVIADIIRIVDLASKRLVIEPIEGLLD